MRTARFREFESLPLRHFHRPPSMATRKPMGPFTLFCVITATLAFFFVVIPIGVSTAGVLAFWGLAKSAAPVVSATSPTTTESTEAAPPPSAAIVVEKPSLLVSTDERPLVVVMRERARWPVEVVLTRPFTVKGDDFEMDLPVGRKLLATALSDDGKLITSTGTRALKIPFEQTDFPEAILRVTEFSPDQQAAIAVRKLRAQPVATDGAARRLLDLKAQFPLLEKHRVSVTIANPRLDPGKPAPASYRETRSDVIEIEVPHSDLWNRYHGMVQTASLESLPVVVAQIEARLSADLAKLRNDAGNSQSGNAQALQSAAWAKSTLQPYLARLKASAGQR